MLNNTRKHVVLALRGKPEGHKSAKNIRKFEFFVAGLLTNTRKREVSGGGTDPPRGPKKGRHWPVRVHSGNSGSSGQKTKSHAK